MPTSLPTVGDRVRGLPVYAAQWVAFRGITTLAYLAGLNAVLGIRFGLLPPELVALVPLQAVLGVVLIALVGGLVWGSSFARLAAFPALGAVALHDLALVFLLGPVYLVHATFDVVAAALLYVSGDQYGVDADDRRERLEQVDEVLDETDPELDPGEDVDEGLRDDGRPQPGGEDGIDRDVDWSEDG